MPETTRLATTIQIWWPAIHVALKMNVTNGRTESFNRSIKKHQTRPLLLPQPRELPAPDTLYHRAHPSPTRRSMNGPPSESKSMLAKNLREVPPQRSSA